ncbi:hypothetical protein ACIPPQ_21235 [Sphingopyxis sp. LARHCG72]
MQANRRMISTVLIGAAALSGPAPDLDVQPRLAMPSFSSPAMPSRLWEGVGKVSVLCLVTLDPALVRRDMLPVRRKMRAALCRHLVDLAAKGAPYPVTELAYADVAIGERDRLTLLFHARLMGEGSDRRILYTIRPYRAGAEADTLFGTTPDLVALGDPQMPDPGLDDALVASLASLLPWRAPIRRIEILPPNSKLEEATGAER